MLQSPKRWHPDTCAHIYRATHTDTEKPVAVGQLNLHAVWGPVQTKQRQTKDSKDTERKSQARYDFLRALSAQTGFQSLTFDYLHKLMLRSWNRNVNIIGRYQFFNPSTIKPVYACVVQPWNCKQLHHYRMAQDPAANRIACSTFKQSGTLFAVS